VNPDGGREEEREEDSGTDGDELAVVADGLTVADGLGVVPVFPFPTLATVVHMEEEGAGCAGGVTGSPWWKVEVPYTPIGYGRKCT
jgi:hypothetical protein